MHPDKRHGQFIRKTCGRVFRIAPDPSHKNKGCEDSQTRFHSFRFAFLHDRVHPYHRL
jgi:hypothetical protein